LNQTEAVGRGIEAAAVPEGGWGLEIRRQRNLNSKLTKNASYQKGCLAAVLVQAILQILESRCEPA
jgi:hypothetical protein